MTVGSGRIDDRGGIADRVGDVTDRGDAIALDGDVGLVDLDRVHVHHPTADDGDVRRLLPERDLDDLPSPHAWLLRS